MIDQFETWMSDHSQLADSSIYKYSHAIRTISNEMIDFCIIDKPLYDMKLLELDIAISRIINHPNFILKNKTGNSMYSNSLKQYRYYLLYRSDDYENDEQLLARLMVDDTRNLTRTEKEMIMKARIGQGPYRKTLLNKYENKCVITGIDNVKLLVASHIKPWSVCDNQERIDGENGLLLSANMDKLFDCGLITFSHSGRLFISCFLGKENEKRLNISNPIFVNLKASPRFSKYLEYHQDVLFVK